MKRSVCFLAASIAAAPSLLVTACGMIHSTRNYVLTVNSTNPSNGVPISVSPSDLNTSGNGNAPFTRLYMPSTVVTLTAPDTASGHNFLSWTGCGNSNKTVCTVTLNASTTVNAAYGSSSLLTPTVTVTSSPTSITTSQLLAVTIVVNGPSGSTGPTGSITLTSGTYTSSATPLANGSATVTVPAGQLAAGTDTLTATYTPDAASISTYNSAAGTGTVTVTPAGAGLITPAVTVTPSPASITTSQSLSVKISVSGGTGNPTPTGSVVLTSGSYTSAASTLTNGSATIAVPAGSLSTGADTLTGTYTPDAAGSTTYNSARGTGSVTVTAPGLITPTVTVMPSPTTITTAQSLSVTVTVSGGSGNATPTGAIVLTSGTYTSSSTALSGGSATMTAAAGSLAQGTDTLTATYTPNAASSATYSSATGTASVTVEANSSGIIGDCGMDGNGAGTGQVDYVEVYSSKYARWCVDTTYWTANRQSIIQFFDYYDGAVAQLISLFNLQPSLPIVVEVTTPTGGACDCGPKFGEKESVVITGDAYSGTFSNPQNHQSIPGFWGYLLTLHETVNAFTGSVSGGWPTDWWADHRSPFPNAMDEQVMKYIGTQQNNQPLLNAAQAQHERFADPKISTYDGEVAMFDNFFDQYGGFAMYSKFFQLVEQDKLSWGKVSQGSSSSGGNSYGVLLSEYVTAYLSMAFGTTSDLTSTFTSAGVGTMDTTEPPYTMNSDAVLGIANAHCSIRAASGAGISVSLQLSQLQSGNYQSAVASGGTQSTCPSECSWNTNQCVAKW